jgi:hypothetical protein
MFINEARLSIEKEGMMTEAKRENIDRFTSICKLRGPHAQVGVNIGTSLHFGDMKIDVSITLTCDQNEVAMDEAARMAIERGHELMNLGLQQHGLEPVKFDPTTLWKVGTQGEATKDRFTQLCSGRGPLAHVGVNAGTTIGYGDIKLKSNVRLACDQTDACLNQAGILCIEKTNEYTNWGLNSR